MLTTRWVPNKYYKIFKHFHMLQENTQTGIVKGLTGRMNYAEEDKIVTG